MALKDVGNKVPIYKLKTTEEVMRYYDEWGEKDKYNKDMVDWNYTGPKETVDVIKKYLLNKDALFRSFLELPSNVITGQFEVKILHYRNSKLVSQQINSINVSKSGISAEIYDIAQNYSTLYGIFAVFLAVLVGWGSNLIFRKV